MGFVIIFNKDTLFALTKMQKAIIAALNREKITFYPHYPLWVPLGEIGEKVFNNPTCIESLEIQKPEIRSGDLVFPVEIKISGEIYTFPVLAARQPPPQAVFTKQETSYHETISDILKSFTEPSMTENSFTNPPVVVGEAAAESEIGENCYGTKRRKWVKCRK